MRKEFFLYLGLIFAIILNKFNVPFAEYLLIIYSSFLAILYYFTFQHWFANESSRFFIVAGKIIMSLLPIAVMFSFKQYKGADIVLLISVFSAIFYWIVRMFRGTFVKEKIQDIWLYVLISLPGLVYLAVFL